MANLFRYLKKILWNNLPTNCEVGHKHFGLKLCPERYFKLKNLYFELDCYDTSKTNDKFWRKFQFWLKKLTKQIIQKNLLFDFYSSSGSRSHTPDSSVGGSYPQELIDNFALNLHRFVFFNNPFSFFVHQSLFL